MAQFIGANGQTLPPPQALYPQYIQSLPNVSATNEISLPPGGEVILPPGRWWVSTGNYTCVQVYDMVSTEWRTISTDTGSDGRYVESDGVNYRIYNPTGFPQGAVVNNGGTGYTSAPTVTASVGASTWTAIVGGGVSAINLTSGGGSGFSVPPLVNIAAPPSPGVQATAVANISGGVVTTFSVLNPGAGYTSAPLVTLVPQQSDFNLATTSTTKVVVPAATTQLSFVGQVTAVLLANEGNNPLTSVPALTFTGGGGSGATATPVMAFTVTGATVSTPGSGYTAPVTIQTAGGTITSSAATSNTTHISTGQVTIRNANIVGAINGSTGISGIAVNGIIDGGLFQAPPSAYVTNFNTATGTSGSAYTPAVVALTVGGVNDTVFVTPL